MISASKEKTSGHSADSTFAIIAKAHRRARRQHLTLDLCEAVQQKTGKPLVPSSPAGLMLLLDAMQPNISQHKTRPDSVDVGGARVKELLKRYGEGGQVGASLFAVLCCRRRCCGVSPSIECTLGPCSSFCLRKLGWY